MFSFSDTVASILLEAPPVPGAKKPKWLEDIIKKHAALGLGDVDDNTYDRILAAVFRPNQNRFTDNELENTYNVRRIVDALEQYKQGTGDQKTLNRDIINSSEPGDLQVGNKIAQKIQAYSSSEQWKLENPLTSSNYPRVEDKYDKMSAVALDTFSNKSIFDTVVEIVKRRTNVFDRISNLKSLTQPFANLILDIFRSPDEYIAGQKKVSADFFNIVDNLYVTSLFQIGKAAKDFYATQITRLKIEPTKESPDEQAKRIRSNVGRTQAGSQSSGYSQWAQNAGKPPSSSTQWTGTQGTTTQTGPGRTNTTYRPVNSSLNYFEQLINVILLNEVGFAQTIAQGAQNFGSNIKTASQAVSSPQNRQLFMQIYKKVRADQANYTNFITNKPIQYKSVDSNTGKETGTTGHTDPNAYTIGEIKKMESPEARALIKALQSIANYTRKGVGAGQRLAGANQVLGAIGKAALPGGSIYTGPG